MSDAEDVVLRLDAQGRGQVSVEGCDYTILVGEIALVPESPNSHRAVWLATPWEHRVNGVRIFREREQERAFVSFKVRNASATSWIARSATVTAREASRSDRDWRCRDMPAEWRKRR